MKEDIADNMIAKYRNQLGCTDTGVCWCEVCTGIECIVSDVFDEIVRSLKNS